jgi:hypothetical protein
MPVLETMGLPVLNASDVLVYDLNPHLRQTRAYSDAQSYMKWDRRPKLLPKIVISNPRTMSLFPQLVAGFYPFTSCVGCNTAVPGCCRTNQHHLRQRWMSLRHSQRIFTTVVLLVFHGSLCIVFVQAGYEGNSSISKPKLNATQPHY